MITNKINIAPWFKFTFLVWMKSTPVIILVYILNVIFMRRSGLITADGISYLVALATLRMLIFITPSFVLMLIGAYFLNKTNWSITKQKIFIFCIYAFAILIQLATTGATYDKFKIILFTLFLLTIPAVMIYFTTLLPSNKQLVDNTERDDVIDDISFED